MIFSSVLFLFRFLPLFLICYFLAPGRMKNIILLLGSLIFYAWGEPVYVVLMLFSTISDYVHGLQLEKAKAAGKSGRGWLVSSVIINLLMLGFFKYSDFLIGNCNSVFGTQIPLLNLPLPIGISFYTFQTMSYSIDVYRGEVKAQKNLLDFAVFVTMFPQLIAGPIVKYKTAAPFLNRRSHSVETAAYGIRRFVVGLAKKVLFANNAGLIWTEISAMNLSELPAATAWFGIIAYALQIYFDFSGYSDMAIGLGAMVGFEFPENFNYPYISRSITEFWRRWHISLSTWFKEYVYIPLGGNRKGLPRQILNLLIVWALTGIWHGANWNFLLWGLWFGFFLILEKLVLGKWLAKLPAFVGWIYSMVLVLLGWVFFALEGGAGQVFRYLGAMFGRGGLGDQNTLYLFNHYGISILVMLVGMTPAGAMLYAKVKGMLQRKLPGILFENLVLAVLLLVSVGYIVEASYNPFLYFRF